MSNEVIITDTILGEIARVYGDEVFEILRDMRGEGYAIVFTDDLGREMSRLDPMDLGKL